VPSEPPDFAPLRFSTGALPEPARIPFWREVFAREIVRVDIEPRSDVEFQAEAALRLLPGLKTLSCISAPARYRRTSQLVADGDDALSVLINVAGTMTASQRDREVSLGPGDATLLLHAEPAAMTHSQIHYQAVVVPRAALAPLVADVENAAMRLIPHASDALRLLAGYLNTVREDLLLATPDLRQLVATHVQDLVAMLIGATREGTAIAADRGVRATRLATIKADIIEHLGRRDLSLVAVAARQHVSPRYVQRLFESEEGTFSEFVLDQRLARAHRLLGDPRCADRTVSAIAFASGFGDLSYFNRVFRARYGATPSDVRADAQRG
jgi:AraC-like DNA-binding protein